MYERIIVCSVHTLGQATQQVVDTLTFLKTLPVTDYIYESVCIALILLLFLNLLHVLSV